MTTKHLKLPTRENFSLKVVFPHSKHIQKQKLEGESPQKKNCMLTGSGYQFHEFKKHMT